MAKDIDDAFLIDYSNQRVGEAWQQTVAYKFPHLSHMFEITFDGHHLHVEFIDVSAPYKQEIVDFIEGKIKEGFK